MIIWDTASLLARARALVSSTVGMHGLRSLALSFAALDAKGTGAVPREAAKYAKNRKTKARIEAALRGQITAAD